MLLSDFLQALAFSRSGEATADGTKLDVLNGPPEGLQSPSFTNLARDAVKKAMAVDGGAINDYGVAHPTLSLFPRLKPAFDPMDPTLDTSIIENANPQTRTIEPTPFQSFFLSTVDSDPLPPFTTLSFEPQTVTISNPLTTFTATIPLLTPPSADLPPPAPTVITDEESSFAPFGLETPTSDFATLDPFLQTTTSTTNLLTGTAIPTITTDSSSSTVSVPLPPKPTTNTSAVRTTPLTPTTTSSSVSNTTTSFSTTRSAANNRQTGRILGAFFGVLGLIILLFLVQWLMRRKRKRRMVADAASDAFQRRLSRVSFDMSPSSHTPFATAPSGITRLSSQVRPDPPATRRRVSFAPSQPPSYRQSQTLSARESQMLAIPPGQISSTARQPETSANRQSQMPVNRQSQMLANRQSQMLANRQSQTLTNRQSQMLANRQSQALTNRQSQVPTNRQSQVPTNRQSQIPANRQSQVPATTRSRIPASLQPGEPATPQSQMEASQQSQMPATQQPENAVTQQSGMQTEPPTAQAESRSLSPLQTEPQTPAPSQPTPPPRAITAQPRTPPQLTPQGGASPQLTPQSRALAQITPQSRAHARFSRPDSMTYSQVSPSASMISLPYVRDTPPQSTHVSPQSKTYSKLLHSLSQTHTSPQTQGAYSRPQSELANNVRSSQMIQSNMLGLQAAPHATGSRPTSSITTNAWVQEQASRMPTQEPSSLLSWTPALSSDAWAAQVHEAVAQSTSSSPQTSGPVPSQRSTLNSWVSSSQLEYIGIAR